MLYKSRTAIIFGLIIFLSSCLTSPEKNNLYSVRGNLIMNGEPVANANICIDGYDNLKTISDDAGKFLISEVPEGTQTIIVNKFFIDSSHINFSKKIEVSGNLKLDSLLLPKPVLLHQITVTTKSSITLVWDISNANDFREYKIYRHYSSGLDENTGTLIHVSTLITDTTFTDSLLDVNTTYFYRVYTMNAYGKIGGSNIVSGTTDDLYEISPYTLIKTLSIGAPLANPVGIASDQDNLWLMFGQHNASEHYLVYYNVNTYQVIKSFTLHNLIQQLGTGVYGITWDGEAVWISVSGNTNKVVKVDPDNGSIIQTWASPTVLGPSDLEWSGSVLWINTGGGLIYTLNPVHGGSSLFLSFPRRTHGIAIRDNEIWMGDFFKPDIHIFNKTNGNHMGYIKNDISNVGNFCFHSGQLAIIENSGISFYDIQTQ